MSDLTSGEFLALLVIADIVTEIATYGNGIDYTLPEKIMSYIIYFVIVALAIGRIYVGIRDGRKD